MTDDQLLRYSRHILLDNIAIEGQERISQSHALIVGAGGLGSPAALYLAAAGVGTITLLDHDHVDLTNLQRQIAHSTQAANTQQSKVESAKAAMQRINPEVTIHAVCDRATPERLDPYVLRADVVLDCTDNFSTRHAINTACVKHRKPLISGSCVKMDGQLAMFAPHLDAESPCYACVFAQNEAFEEVACSTMGVLGPLVGVIGSMQAAEALKFLANPTAKPKLLSRLLMLDGLAMRWDEVKTKRQNICKVCASTVPEPVLNFLFEA